VPQVAACEAGGRERAVGREERLDAGVEKAHAGDARAGGADDRTVEHLQGGGSDGCVVADAFDVQEAPVGGVACLRQGGEVSQLLADADADAEVAWLVEGGLSASEAYHRPTSGDLGLRNQLLTRVVAVGCITQTIAFVAMSTNCTLNTLVRNAHRLRLGRRTLWAVASLVLVKDTDQLLVELLYLTIWDIADRTAL
jgi:hypothetical protein